MACLLWTMVLTYPLMTAVQLVSAPIGRVTVCGLAKNMGDLLRRPLVATLIVLLSAANTMHSQRQGPIARVEGAVADRHHEPIFHSDRVRCGPAKSTPIRQSGHRRPGATKMRPRALP